MAPLRRPVWIFVLVGVPACGLVVLPIHERDDLPDAGADAGAEAGSDTAFDVGASDGTAAVDVDAGDAGETSQPDGGAGDAGFCATLSPTPTFCDDFDENPLGFGWDDVSRSAGATYAFDTSSWRSPPNAILLALPFVDGGAPSPPYHVSQVKAITGNVTHATLAFDARADTLGTGTLASLARFQSQGKAVEVRLELDAAASPVAANVREADLGDAGYAYHSHALPGGGLLTGAWTHVVLDLTLSPSAAATFSVSIDGASALSSTALVGTFPPQPITVEVGIGYVSPPLGGWRVRYDNVTIDVQR
jgi:hypothetical protein